MSELTPLRRALIAVRRLQARVAELEGERAEPIALIGLGCRLPGGAVDAPSLWRLLRDGIDAVGEIPPDRRDLVGIGPRRGGFLSGVDQFDPRFYGISPREAQAMDPRQRLLLDTSWEALEHAGRAPTALRGSRTGVFVGIGASGEAAGRISGALGLEGPSLAVDAACSSSLVAVHLACQSLRSRESDLAICGGVHLMPSAADGPATAEGCGAVVLERLSDALSAGDRILAVIRGSAVNQDGRIGPDAPNGLARQAVIREALLRAGVEPARVGYVEAHGAGIPLGDPVEIDALVRVLGEGRSVPFLVGSIKANLGHAGAAAGIAGLLEAVLCLVHRTVPPHLRRPRPHLPEEAPFRVPAAPTPWPAIGDRRIAGVSAFGSGGTNAHLILEEAPSSPLVARSAQDYYLLPISARDEGALQSLAEAFDPILASADVRDAVHTASVRRAHHPRRLALVGADREALRQELAAFLRGEPSDGVRTGLVPPRGARTAWVFCGQGVRWSGRGQRLMATEPAFAEAVARCDAILPGSRIGLEDGIDEALLRRADRVQPLLFAIQIGLWALWRSWGVEPSAVIGHGLGELAASVACGALPLEQAARIVGIRSRLVARANGSGAMAVAEIPRDRAEALIHGRPIAVAAHHGPDQVLLSGDPDALGGLLADLEGEGVFCLPIDVDHASHSPRMDPLLPELIASLGEVRSAAPSVPMISTVTGRAIGPGELDAGYWGRNLREPVLFYPALLQLFQEGHDLFLELGPHPALTSVIERVMRHVRRDGEALPSLRREEDPARSLRLALASLHVRGVPIAWEAAAPAGGFAELPLTPRSPERCGASAPAVLPLPSVHPLLGERWSSSQDDRAEIFQAELDPREPGHVADHRVEGAAVLPGAAYFEMALAAGRRVAGARVVVASDLWEALALPPDGTKTVQTVLVPDTDRWTFRISSASEGGWVLHASGTLAVDDTLRSPLLPIERIRARCAEEISGERFHEEVDRAGVSHGPRNRCVERVWRREGESLAELRGVDPDGYEIHPALLDGAFQVLGAAASRRIGGTFLPIGAGAVRAPGTAAGRLWCHAVCPLSADPSVLTGDLTLAREDGTVVVEIEALRIRRVGRPRETFADWLYGLDWISSPRPEPSGPRSWAVVGSGPSAAAIRELLERSGDRHAPISEAWGVVHAEALDQRGPLSGIALLPSLLLLVRELGALPDPPRLFVLTRRTQPIAGWVDPAGAPLWGFVRSVAHELPELRPTCIDIGDDPLAPLVDELRADSEEDRVVLRGTDRRVARLERRRLESVGSRRDAVGTYLVAGGLEGLGLLAARWLVDTGARRLVLMGRSPPSEEAWEAIAALGAEVVIAVADVAVEGDLARILSGIAESERPLRGVLHAAGVLDDGPLAEQTPDRLACVLTPKVQGAWNLHLQTRELPLELFVMFSSAAAVLGAPGQAGSAASDAFLGALAHHRRQMGLPALAIDWGTWAGVGLAASRSRLASGIRGLPPEEGIAALDHLAGTSAVQVAVIPYGP